MLHLPTVHLDNISVLQEFISIVFTYSYDGAGVNGRRKSAVFLENDRISFSHMHYRILLHNTHTHFFLQFPDQLREALNENKDLKRQNGDLSAANIALTQERDSLANALSGTEDQLRDAEQRCDSLSNALAQAKQDFEHRLREKDDELETIKYVMR